MNIQTMIDYFDVLRAYECRGLLVTHPEDHIAYVTRVALCSLTGSDAKDDWAKEIVNRTAHYIRAWAAFKSGEGRKYEYADFALHVMSDDEQPSVLFTVVLSQPRCWWWPWRRRERLEVITY